MKTLFRLVPVVFVLLLVTVLVRTYQVVSLQLPSRSFQPIFFDEKSSAEILSRTLQFKTISFQDESQTDQSQFDALIAFLQEAFPAFHRAARQELFNDRHLLYTWEGSDPSLKPVLFMGHIDVVPVSDESIWEQPAFAGIIENGYIWGRGAIDDKSTVTGLLNSAEVLIKSGFRPERTIVFAFGGDEETGGRQGATQIAQTLKQRGITFEFILDEGGAITQGVVEGADKPVALIGIAEKGYVSLELKVQTQGGHSSMPSAQTAIGILSAGLARLEKHQMPTRLELPQQEMFRYLAPEMPFIKRMVISNLWLFEPLVKQKMSATASGNAAIRTTTAITMFNSGIKENVLPTDAIAVVNFRILPGDSVDSVMEHVRNVISDKRIEISNLSIQQEPSGISDISSIGYAKLAQSIRDIYPGVVVTPYLVVGATDSRHYSELSNNIFRFMPVRMTPEDLKRFHGDNERIAIKDYSYLVQFYMQLIKAL